MNYVRDHVQIPVAEEYFQRRSAEGWQLRVIEWERVDGSQTAEPANAYDNLPYGLEVVSGTLHLKENPDEMAVLLAILELVVKDRSVPVIAEELNRRDFRNRAGALWTAPAVFDLLPRVIEMGPTLLKSKEWVALRAMA